ncbi:MAG: glycoside hydrolase family 3 C-terminal domain-containing protein, partial [Phycisphaerae bacterium]
VNPRNYWEYYTRAYRTCVLDADVFTFMSAYSAINGIPCTADRFLLTSLLRDRWGFRGYVTSDCDSVAVIFNSHHYVPTLHQAAALAMQAGCDLNCQDTMPTYLGKAVGDELVSEADISRAITRLLTVRVLFGEFDSPESVPYNTISFDVVDSPAHRELALDAARQSIVLLKNDNNFLPLQKSALKTVAVIGPTAGQCHLGGYSGSPFLHISPYAGIAEALGAKIYKTREHVWPDQLAGMSSGVGTQSSSEGGMNIDWIGDGAWVEYKPQDFTSKTHIAVRVASPVSGTVIAVHIDTLNGPQIATINVPNSGGFQNWTTVSAPIRPTIGPHKVFFKFSGNSGTICNVEWFQLQPMVAARKPQPKPGQPVVVFKPGCSVQGPKDEKMFAEAVEAAKNADVVIMVCGVDQSVDAEAHDRKDITLTGVQHELIQACYKANAKTMLVISSNNTVAVNWEQEHLPAIVSAIFAGQAQGTAIADVLFGNYNPGGKTCCTWYKSVDQLPPFHNYDIMKGRTYMYFEGEPLYPFGYGLSYTTFKFSGFKISSDSLAAGGEIKISAVITNTGKRSGTEVAQFYITAPKSPVKRPIKQLVGFQRVELKPGESRRVTFTLPYNEQALWYWHEDLRKFVLQPGTLKLMIGGSSAAIHLTGQVNIQACTDGTIGGPETLNTVAAKSVASR